MPSSVETSLSSCLKDRLEDLWDKMPENDGDIEESIKDRLERQVGRLEKTILTIWEREEPSIAMSSTKSLLNNCIVFSNVFERKALDAGFDRYDMVGYAPSAHNIRDAEFAVKEKCIYLNELMQCSFIIERDGYNAISMLGLPQIILLLNLWHKLITRNKFSLTCTPEQRQQTMNVAAFFGASARSLNRAAARYKLQVPGKHSSTSIADSKNDESEAPETLGINHVDESSTRNVHGDNEGGIDDGDDAPSNSLATSLGKPSGSRSRNHVPTPILLVPSVGIAEAMKYVIIMRKWFPAEIEERLAAGNWEKVYTPSYVRCWQTTLVEAAPRLLGIFTAIKDSCNSDVGEAHVWDPTVSKTEKPYCLYPQLFHDEVASDFFNEWPGYNEDMDGYIQGRPNGSDILWLAVQFWIRFADTDGVGDPPLRTREELALKSEVVYAMGKCLGASWVLLRRFEATWGRKMKSDDPNNAKRKGPHGFHGSGYYKNKRGPTDPLRYGR
ncbi:hypothetical protein EYC84_004926 [Monilinia fructicola]|uniref:Uncharacterized protein n=1 Tax=Monilinia fructicola TaxID=38448 RepID=A0A5M9K4U9_MONFR|nr:hypothetical protein EYC84_004926 [Monilinia fructicola]